MAYAALLLGGYTPPAESPAELLFPPEQERDLGLSLFLFTAAAFCVGFTAWAWKNLLGGARAMRKQKEQIEELKQELQEKREPPGYN